LALIFGKARRRSLCIARGAAPFILLQRTQLQSKKLRAALDRLRIPYVSTGLFLEGSLRRRAIEKAYVREIEADFGQIEAYLPRHAASIMDFGCGIAALDALLFQHYDGQVQTLHLVDRSQINKEIYFGFERQAAFYNSLEWAKKTLTANGVPEDRIRLIEAPPDGRLPHIVPLDLVVSVLSWGFHFPISTYLDSVCDRLAPAGRLIVDVRRNTDGVDSLAARFANLSVISESRKVQRICARMLREPRE
jgi:SAM-dependent methyltransferase